MTRGRGLALYPFFYFVLLVHRPKCLHAGSVTLLLGIMRLGKRDAWKYPPSFLSYLYSIRKLLDSVGVVWCGVLFVLARVAQDVLAVGVEAQVPQADRGHELLRGLELAVAAEDGVDELGAGVLPQLRRGILTVLLPGLQHRRLARLEQLLQLRRQPLAGLDEVVHHLAVLLLADAGHAFFGALDFARELD
jgi:hypothetical protein